MSRSCVYLILSSLHSVFVVTHEVSNTPDVARRKIVPNTPHSNAASTLSSVVFDSTVCLPLAAVRGPDMVRDSWMRTLARQLEHSKQLQPVFNAAHEQQRKSRTASLKGVQPQLAQSTEWMQRQDFSAQEI